MRFGFIEITLLHLYQQNERITIKPQPQCDKNRGKDEMKKQFLDATAKLRRAKNENEIRQANLLKSFNHDSATTPAHIEMELNGLKEESLTISRKIYCVLTDLHPHHPEVFFAFSKKQWDEGVIKLREHSDAKIYSAGMGMYGTKEGLDYYLNFYNDRDEAIKTLCDVQAVYLYECENHEFMLTHEDTEALEIVFNIFGPEGVKRVKRKRGAWSHKTEASEVLK